MPDDQPPPPLPPGAPPGWRPGPAAERPPAWGPPPEWQQGAQWQPGPAPPGPPPPEWQQGAQWQTAPPPPGWQQPAPPGWQQPSPPTGGRLPVRPHPVFLAMCAAFAGCGVLAAKEVGNPRVWVFGFVALGWVISLCLHEFAHAAVAWKGGDRSVEARGYLTLHPARYMNSQMSIVFPILIVLIGGIALPGGAVIVDRRAVRERRMRSLISAAGPLTNLACALACGLPIALGLVHPNANALFTAGKTGAFPAALALLGLLEIIATVLNALPIPGFDGFGVIAPYLPEQTVRDLMPVSRYAWFALFFVLFFSASGRDAFWNVASHASALIGVPIRAASDGQVLFTFWRKLS